MGAGSGSREYVMESSRGRPSIALRSLAAAVFIGLALASWIPKQALIALASSACLLALSVRSLRAVKALTPIIVPVIGVGVYTLLTSTPSRAAVLTLRILTMATGSLAVVYGASIGEVLWLSRLFRFSKTLLMIALTSLESAVLLKGFVREAQEGVRARGVSCRGFKGVLRKYTLIARILFYRALIRAEVSAEVMALNIVNPLRIKPLYRVKLGVWDAAIAALIAVSLTAYALITACIH